MSRHIPILYNNIVIYYINERDIFSVFSSCNKLYNPFTTPTHVVYVLIIYKRTTLKNMRVQENDLFNFHFKGPLSLLILILRVKILSM